MDLFITWANAKLAIILVAVKKRSAKVSKRIEKAVQTKSLIKISVINVITSLLLIACDSSSNATSKADSMWLLEVYGLHPQDICHFGLSSDLVLNPKELKFIGMDTGNINIYKSLSGYEYACYLEEDHVIWRAYPNGRWRNSYAQGDSKITWKITEKGVAIERVHLDGSNSINNYNFN